jgi:hypothetical protein
MSELCLAAALLLLLAWALANRSDNQDDEG